MSRTYLNKQNYIGILKACLSARDDFANLTYHRDAFGNEYMILSDIIGQVCMLNVTGYDHSKLFHNIAEIECGKKPVNLITDPTERLRVARLK